MTEFPTSPASAEEVGDLAPVEVLYEFDGPRIFTTRDPTGKLLLAYLCDEEGATARFLVAPTDSHVVDEIKRGNEPVLDAIRQPWLWVVDVKFTENGQSIEKCAHTDFASVPAEVLPRPGTMLWPWLQPLVTVRIVGADAEPGNIRPGVIQQAVKSGVDAVRKIAAYVKRKRKDVTMAALFDMRATRVALASFEVSFRESDLVTPVALLIPVDGEEPPAPPASPTTMPPSTEAPATGEDVRTAEQIKKDEEAAVDEVGDLLARGLDWALSPDSDFTAKQAFESKMERAVVLDAVRGLTAAISKTVSSVEVGGRLVAGRMPRRRTETKAILTEDAQKRIDYVLEHPEEEPAVARKEVFFEGRVRVSDKDQRVFKLRDVKGRTRPVTFRYTAHLDDKVNEAFYRNERVRVRALQRRNDLEARDIGPIESKSPAKKK